MQKKIKMLGRACPVCSSRKDSDVFAEENFDPGQLDDYSFASRKFPELMHYRLIICPQCELLYANPIPTLKSLSTAYHEAAFDSSEEARYAARTYGLFLPSLKQKICDTVGALDIGTGDGAFLGELLGMGFTGVKGVEPSLAPIKAAKPDIRPLIRHGFFKPKYYQRNSLSLVTCFQTFEHLYEPLEMCRGAYQILKKEGAFFAVCHNRLSLSARLLGMKSPIFDIEHLQLFSPKSARAMMEKAGFTQVEVRKILNTYPLHYWLKLLPLPRKFKSSLMKLLKIIGIGYLPIPLPAGNMAVIGFKK